MTRALLALALVLLLTGMGWAMRADTWPVNSSQAAHLETEDLQNGLEPQAPPWLELARSHLGTNPGSWKKDWCSEFVATVIPGPHHFKKWSWTGWKEWGVESPPRLGAVVILHNHTALINGPCTETHCPIIGGNQRSEDGRKLVTETTVERKFILSIRWPEWAV